MSPTEDTPNFAKHGIPSLDKVQAKARQVLAGQDDTQLQAMIDAYAAKPDHDPETLAELKRIAAPQSAKTGAIPSQSDNSGAVQQLREAILGVPVDYNEHGPLYLEDVFPNIATSDFADQIVALFQKEQIQLAYDHKVAENIRILANANVPGEWVDPTTGKKLYNGASLIQLVSELAKEATTFERITGQEPSGEFERAVPTSVLILKKQELERGE